MNRQDGFSHRRKSAYNMVDIFTPEIRSKIMSRIRSKDTKPEKTVRSLLHRMGYRFRLHRKSLPGCPDIVFPKRKKAIYVHGCFWHGHVGCKHATIPKTRPDYWSSKISTNALRDAKNQKALCEIGWDVLVVWECETNKLDELKMRLTNFLVGAC